MNIEQIMTMLGLSDLQFALAAIGVLLLVAIVGFNVKHARARRKAANFDEPSAGDRFAREPSFGQSLPDGDAEDLLGSNTAISMLSGDLNPEIFSIDPRIDCVISLRFDQAISGAEILAEIDAWRLNATQSDARWMCEGLHYDTDAVANWEILNAEASYTELQLAIQLASRRGPIGVLELSNFCSRAQALAEMLDSQIDMPSVTTMLESAKDLDTLAAESDIQLGINVLFDDAYPWANFDSLMHQHGFKLARGGRSYEFFSNSKLIFSCAELDPNIAVKQVTLLLEVPLVDVGERAFERMLKEGVEIAQAAHGRIVDDNGINLTAAAVISIRQHLDGLYANLEKGGVLAGSSTASRLFS